MEVWDILLCAMKYRDCSVWICAWPLHVCVCVCVRSPCVLRGHVLEVVYLIYSYQGDALHGWGGGEAAWDPSSVTRAFVSTHAQFSSQTEEWKHWAYRHNWLPRIFLFPISCFGIMLLYKDRNDTWQDTVAIEYLWAKKIQIASLRATVGGTVYRR